MPIIRVIIKHKDINFWPLELELVQKYEIPKTAAMKITIGRMNFII